MSWQVTVKSDSGTSIQTTLSSDDSSLTNWMDLLLKSCTVPPMTTMTVTITKGK